MASSCEKHTEGAIQSFTHIGHIQGAPSSARPSKGSQRRVSPPGIQSRRSPPDVTPLRVSHRKQSRCEPHHGVQYRESHAGDPFPAVHSKDFLRCVCSSRSHPGGKSMVSNPRIPSSDPA